MARMGWTDRRGRATAGMKEHTHVINRAALLACALGVALLAPSAHRAARADAGVNGPVLAIVGMGGKGLPSPHFSLVAVGAGGVTVLARQIPNTFGALAPSPRGRYVAIAGRIAGLWEVDADGAHLHRVFAPPASHASDAARVTAVAWSPDRYTLAYALEGARRRWPLPGALRWRGTASPAAQQSGMRVPTLHSPRISSPIVSSPSSGRRRDGRARWRCRRR